MSHGMSLGYRQTCDLQHTQVITLNHAFGETSGDIPIFSLHKIKRLLARVRPDVSGEVMTMLERGLLKANREYKEDVGRDWNCIPANYLIECLLRIDKEIEEINEDGLNTLPKEALVQVALFRKLLTKKRNECHLTLKQWFEVKYDLLYYNMDGKIPWAIVQRLRRNLHMWVLGTGNPFEQNINEMVLEVAKENNIHTDDPETAWKNMGGQLFTEED